MGIYPRNLLWNQRIGWPFSNYKYIFFTLMGMKGDTFISLPFLDQILSAEFLSKIPQLTAIELIWHPAIAKLIES